MPTEGRAPPPIFEGFEGRQVVGSFDSRAVASNGGAAVLREADGVVGLTAQVSR